MSNNRGGALDIKGKCSREILRLTFSLGLIKEESAWLSQRKNEGKVLWVDIHNSKSDGQGGTYKIGDHGYSLLCNECVQPT